MQRRPCITAALTGALALGCTDDRGDDADGGGGTTSTSSTTSDDPATTLPPPTTDPGTTSTTTGMADSTSTPATGTDTSSGPGLEGTLELWWIDTEGGAATLIVTPEGPLVLVDAGNPGDRDADRIAAVVEQELGADHIDLCIVTHYHGDHVGGVPPLTERVPIDAYWDHGESVEQGSMGGMALWQGYLAVAADNRTVVAPGEVHDVGGLEISIVSSHGALLQAPLPGAGAPNPACRGAATMPHPDDENAMSVGFVARFGTFEFLDLGDLYWDQEHALVCPNNRLGSIDLYQTTHHGLSTSGAAQLVHGIAPLVAVMNNGPHKGGSAEAFDIVTLAASAPELWQVHRALDNDDAHNTLDDRIANPGEGEADEAHWIRARIDATGLIELTNGRNGHTQAYQAR
jgi:competence protein ComEC